MIEIRRGQVWAERGPPHRVGTVRWCSIGEEPIVRLDITAPNRPGIRSWTKILGERLRREWELIAAERGATSD